MSIQMIKNSYMPETNDYFEGLPDNYPQFMEAITLLEETMEEVDENGTEQEKYILKEALRILNKHHCQEA